MKKKPGVENLVTPIILHNYVLNSDEGLMDGAQFMLHEPFGTVYGI
jgi:hypothetical protein